MSHVAFYTFGFLRGPWGSPEVRGFEARLGRVFEAAERSPGIRYRLE